jgi:serine kinase of HPr protein (carbohydrate metabolism regulator)
MTAEMKKNRLPEVSPANLPVWVLSEGISPPSRIWKKCKTKLYLIWEAPANQPQLDLDTNRDSDAP